MSYPPEPVDELDDAATLLLGRAYDILRSIEKYGDWDAPFWGEVVEVKEAIGDYLWPSPGEAS